jgi:hypothetical protein
VSVDINVAVFALVMIVSKYELGRSFIIDSSVYPSAFRSMIPCIVTYRYPFCARVRIIDQIRIALMFMRGIGRTCRSIGY